MVHGITWKLYAKMFKLHHFVIKSNGNVIWRYQALGNHQSATLKGFQHKYRFNSPPSAAPSTPGRFRDKVSLIKCSTHILSPSNKDVHNGSRSWWNAFNEPKYFQYAMKLEEKPHQMEWLHKNVLKKSESCCQCEGRTTSALFMTSSRCPVYVATITLHSLNVSRFSVAMHRMSELVKSDKRGLSKLLVLCGGIDKFQRRCRGLDGSRPEWHSGSRSGPSTYRLNVCVRVKERSVLHCFPKVSCLCWMLLNYFHIHKSSRTSHWTFPHPRASH